jgi:hypothetical protein
MRPNDVILTEDERAAFSALILEHGPHAAAAALTDWQGAAGAVHVMKENYARLSQHAADVGAPISAARFGRVADILKDAAARIESVNWCTLKGEGVSSG